MKRFAEEIRQPRARKQLRLLRGQEFRQLLERLLELVGIVIPDLCQIASSGSYAIEVAEGLAGESLAKLIQFLVKFRGRLVLSGVAAPDLEQCQGPGFELWPAWFACITALLSPTADLQVMMACIA